MHEERRRDEEENRMRLELAQQKLLQHLLLLR
jgi:hypothetical protein